MVMFDEQTFTHHAQPGWMSWDEWSPEEDFCRFVGMLQRLVQPSLTLETGVGCGRLTGHLNPSIGAYLGFESNPAYRQPPAQPDEVTPSAEDMATADLVILDSDPAYRFAELSRWADHGKPGSVCVVHDCGNGHLPGTLHQNLGAACRDTGIHGIFLRNPRGGWVAQHP